LKEATDELLMQACAGGDLDAFSEIVLRYQGFAWKMAYRFLGDATEARDIAQEAFLKILEAAPRYQRKGAFRTYFYRALIHLCIVIASTENVPPISTTFRTSPTHRPTPRKS
jgi:RNA polymerase sigma-70 factor (ECF subfamily)